MKKSILIIIAIALFSVINAQNIYVVTKSTDVNPFEHPYKFDDNECDPEMYGTLQWAINKANDDNAESIIEFNIPGSGPHEIVLNYYLPQIKSSTTIDATTQVGYTEGNPAITLSGQNKFASGFDVNNATTLINGIHIKNFNNNGVLLYNASNSRVENCVFTSITNTIDTKTAAVGIRIVGSNNVELYGNDIQVKLNSTSSLSPTYGVFVDKSFYCIIGGTEEGKSNLIANCSYVGVAVRGCNYNKISGNIFYNNEKAIEMVYSANAGIQPPEIIDYQNGILSGTALPNSTIEIFGSTGEENANEYLVSTIADGGGEWLVEVSTEYEYFVGTQRDGSENSSGLSNVFINTITTQLLTMYQNADSIDLDDFLYARILDGALQYEFNVIQADSGVNQIITKDVNYFSLLELNNNEAYYDKNYTVKVRAVFDSYTTEWGEETVLRTIDEQKYQFGKVRLHFKQEHYEEYSSFKISNNVLVNNYIPNFNELSTVSNISEYVFPIKNILQKLHKDPYSCIDLQFDKKFSVDSIVNFFTSTQICEFVVPIYNVKLSVNPIDYSTVDENCWHLTDVSAPEAWDISTGSNSTIIAVLDNTFNIDHEDLRDNILINIEEIPSGVDILDYNGNDFIDGDDLLTYSGYETLRELFEAQPSNIFNQSDDYSDNNINDDIIGWDCGDNDNNILPEHTNGDYYSHGTSVCHVAGGVTNNYNSGIASLSHNIKIIPIKLASDESDYTMNSSYDPLVALDYLISLNEKPDVISMSFTTGTDIPLFEATLNIFYNEFNTISIAAIGNDGAVVNESNPMYPACYNNVVAVGATNSDNEIAEFSNHGTIQNTYVLAPGQDIYTARAGLPLGINNSYDYADGTSFSAPLVAALASLIYSYNPNVTAETVREAIACGC